MVVSMVVSRLVSWVLIPEQSGPGGVEVSGLLLTLRHEGRPGLVQAEQSLMTDLLSCVELPPLTASGPFQSAEDVHLLAILLRVVGSNLFAAFDPILQVILEVLRVERLGQRSRRRRIKIAMTAWSL